MLEQLHGVLPEKAIDVLRQILGQCNAPLVHRGSITLEPDPATVEPDPVYTPPWLPKPVTPPSETTPIEGGGTIIVGGDIIVQGDIYRPNGSTYSPMIWGKAIENWEDLSTDSCYSVRVNPCDNCAGANADGATIHKLWLPKAGDRDANVETGDVLGYLPDPSGSGYVAITDYSSLSIGSTMWWSLAAEIPKGWARMNGSANAAPRGSGIDATGRFLMDTGAAAGSPGGSAVHDHGNTGSSVTGITIADHVHDLQFDTPIVMSAASLGSDPPTDFDIQVLHPTTTGALVLVDGGVITSNGAAIMEGTDADNDLLSDPGHYHTTAPETWLPKHITMILIERIKNTESVPV
jgi:hypothetical protein